ncbi:MAG: hypothetical protein ACXVEU_05395 [Nocardioidaceae bacterium]
MRTIAPPELLVVELDDERAELLPARDTLCAFACTNVVNVVGVNVSIAVNAASINASANALAQQSISSALSG